MRAPLAALALALASAAALRPPPSTLDVTVRALFARGGDRSRLGRWGRGGPADGGGRARATSKKTWALAEPPQDAPPSPFLPPPLPFQLDPASIKRAFDVKTGTPNKTFDPAAAAQNFKAAATNFINATKTGGGAKEAELGTLPARTGIGMLRNPSLAALRVPREGEPVAALGEDLAAPPLAMCGAGIGVCKKGLCCSQSGAW